MANKILLLVTLLSYSIIVSQPFMYILALKHMQLGLEAGSYIEVRKLIDAAMRSSFKYVLYTAVFANLLLLIVNAKTPGSLIFITAAIAFIALVAEILLTIKGSLPINDVINTWSVDNYPFNWIEYRKNWLRIFLYREFASITGFLSLLIGVVFRNN